MGRAGLLGHHLCLCTTATALQRDPPLTTHFVPVGFRTHPPAWRSPKRISHSLQTRPHSTHTHAHTHTHRHIHTCTCTHIRTHTPPHLSLPAGPVLPHDARRGATHRAPKARAYRVALLPSAASAFSPVACCGVLWCTVVCVVFRGTVVCCGVSWCAVVCGGAHGVLMCPAVPHTRGQLPPWRYAHIITIPEGPCCTTHHATHSCCPRPRARRVR